MLGLWAWPRFSEKSGPLTYGPIWSHKLWEMVPDTHLQKSHGPIGGEKWSQQLSKCRYISTDLSTRSIDHGRYRRSIRNHLLENTVDIDGRCRTYGELRSIVDRRLKIEIILWSISSTTPVKIFVRRGAVMSLFLQYFTIFDNLFFIIQARRSFSTKFWQKGFRVVVSSLRKSFWKRHFK